MKKLIQGCALILLAGSMMGNQSCENPQQEARQLRRRVQMGKIQAFPIINPQGGAFDFQGAANVQMYTVLSDSKTFSTARIDPNQIYDPSGLSEDQVSDFNQCDDGSDSITGGGILAKTINVNAYCVIEHPQGVVTGTILDFQLTNGAGASLSLANLAGTIANFGANFDYKKYTLTMEMQISSPLELGNGGPRSNRRVIKSVEQQSYGKTVSGSLGVGFLAGLGLGVNGYQSTPLASVVKDGLSSAVQDLAKQWDSVEPWYAMVVKSCDNFIYINAGNSSDLGLKEGDIVRIQNILYDWEGDKCASNLNGTTPYPSGPVAYAKVVSVGSTLSVAQVFKGDPNYPYDGNQIIHPGARVYMEKMFVPETKTASK